ncbi:aminoglycoside phosphotransferase family protein [Alloyangia pacifica]|uniref:Predicted kinase, aminoglycoside phosphotransferase (APT) family n=1 Tax=Alloyangia pacifica TaxID=311180 RepID=A0A1I6QRQ5_9RHOB|nr:aminoglycoside phosphotransferase family protein [Alloyangia pacifica]SDF96729.1 Predicted kinase, aminoglycoside phosphotransferase (APT) family [Alloyangia pacifica]SFS55161.1 Predicted kinase, aminoglycoside phosphotransferase (APT) family [Alloyangia pacifica]
MVRPDEFAIDDATLARLLHAQAPGWTELPLRRLASSGTDNAIYRLGEHLCVRVPRRPSAEGLLAKEMDWLPRLGGLPLEVPHLRFRGRGDGVSVPDFAVLDWMEGGIASPGAIADWPEAARQLAAFLGALQRQDTRAAPRAGESNHRRGVALRDLSPVTRDCIDLLADEIDAAPARQLWEDACIAAFRGPPVWLHGDLKADNLIARDGTLCGVIDWGLAAIGDPAVDLAAAWSWVAPSAREDFRDALDVDDVVWQRARGWALYGAVIALSYYRGGRNEALCRQSRQTLARLGLLL